jgi:LmbE family N-acetylglucosaminyl deacetylase
MNFFSRRILFLGGHPDDIELGCGAFLHHVLPDSEVRCVTLSGNRKNPELQNVAQEHLTSLSVLGVSREQAIIEDFETRTFPQQRQEVLDYLFQQRLDFKLDMVFVHTRSDIHQDHNVVTEEALRAFRGTTILGFDVIRSSYGFFPHYFVEVSEEHVQAKLDALASYKTYSDKYYFDPSLLRSTMVRHGALAERPYAEGFDIPRIVGTYHTSGGTEIKH